MVKGNTYKFDRVVDPWLFLSFVHDSIDICVFIGLVRFSIIRPFAIFLIVLSYIIGSNSGSLLGLFHNFHHFIFPVKSINFSLLTIQKIGSLTGVFVWARNLGFLSLKRIQKPFQFTSLNGMNFIGKVKPYF